jgi:hypothetical protein
MTTALLHDPLRAVRDALDHNGCDPVGPAHKFTAKCPAHDDRSPSLSVAEGVDRRALVHCHAGCDPGAIVGELGLQLADLFPPGHYNARPVRLLAKPREAVDLVLNALLELEIDYRCTRNADMWMADRCPACDFTASRLLIQRDDGRIRFACMNGCEQVDVLAALIGAEGTP